MADPKLARTMTYGTWNERTRIYEIEGRVLPSVTSIIGMMDKPALINWAAKLAAEYSQEHRDALIQLPADAATDAIKGNWRRSRDKAARFGTQVHEAIENDQIPLKDDPTYGYVQQALIYLEDRELEVVGQEITVISLEHGYAGTMDLLAMDPDGSIRVADWKSGKGLYDSAALQITALMNADHIMGKDDWVTRPWDGAQVGEAVRLTSDRYYSETILNNTTLADKTLDAFLGLIPVWHYKTQGKVWE
jgi:hypothetical protein